MFTQSPAPHPPPDPVAAVLTHLGVAEASAANASAAVAALNPGGLPPTRFANLLDCLARQLAPAQTRDVYFTPADLSRIIGSYAHSLSPTQMPTFQAQVNNALLLVDDNPRPVPQVQASHDFGAVRQAFQASAERQEETLSALARILERSHAHDEDLQRERLQIMLRQANAAELAVVRSEEHEYAKALRKRDSLVNQLCEDFYASPKAFLDPMKRHFREAKPHLRGWVNRFLAILEPHSSRNPLPQQVVFTVVEALVDMKDSDGDDDLVNRHNMAALATFPVSRQEQAVSEIKRANADKKKAVIANASLNLYFVGSRSLELQSPSATCHPLVSLGCQGESDDDFGGGIHADDDPSAEAIESRRLEDLSSDSIYIHTSTLDMMIDAIASACGLEFFWTAETRTTFLGNITLPFRPLHPRAAKNFGAVIAKNVLTFIPVSTTNHYICFVLTAPQSDRSRMLFSVDSLPSFRPAERSEAERRLMSLLSAAYDGPISLSRVDRQQKGVDCGICVVEVVAGLLLGLLPTQIRREQTLSRRDLLHAHDQEWVRTQGPAIFSRLSLERVPVPILPASSICATIVESSPSSASPDIPPAPIAARRHERSPPRAPSPVSVDACDGCGRTLLDAPTLRCINCHTSRCRGCLSTEAWARGTFTCRACLDAAAPDCCMCGKHIASVGQKTHATCSRCGRPAHAKCLSKRRDRLCFDCQPRGEKQPRLPNKKTGPVVARDTPTEVSLACGRCRYVRPVQVRCDTCGTPRCRGCTNTSADVVFRCADCRKKSPKVKSTAKQSKVVTTTISSAPIAAAHPVSPSRGSPEGLDGLRTLDALAQARSGLSEGAFTALVESWLRVQPLQPYKPLSPSPTPTEIPSLQTALLPVEPKQVQPPKFRVQIGHLAKYANHSSEGRPILPSIPTVPVPLPVVAAVRESPRSLVTARGPPPSFRNAHEPSQPASAPSTIPDPREGSFLLAVAACASVSKVPHQVLAALAVNTREDHVSALRQIGRLAKVRLLNNSQIELVPLLVETVDHARRKRKWKWNTTSTKLANLAGAFRRLTMYCGESYSNIELKTHPMWQDYVRRVGAEMKSEPVDRSKDISQEELFDRITANPEDLALAALFEWLCVGRPGAQFHLRCDGVSFDRKSRELSIDVDKHKTRNQTGTFVAHTIIPERFGDRVDEFLKRRAATALPFLFSDESALNELVDIPKLCRDMATAVGAGGLMIRRGAIRFLADMGASPEDIRLLSRHTNAEQVRQYAVRQEVTQADKRSRMLKLGATLAGGGILSHDSIMDDNEGPRIFAPPGTHRNDGMPGWREINRASSSAIGCKSWPLHLKAVRSVALDQLVQLARRHGKSEKLDLALSPLNSPDFYRSSSPPEGPVPVARYAAEELAEMVTKGFIEEVPPGEAVLGHVKKFWVAEPQKLRRRDISHTITANQVPRVLDCLLPSVSQRVDTLSSSTWAVAFDFAQCFSAYTYAPGVRNYHVFASTDGTLYRLVRLAMGQSHSCDLAQLVIELVLDELSMITGVPRPNMLGYIDNGLVGVDSEAAGAQVRLALEEICDKLRIDLNPIEVAQKIEFTGMSLDFENKTVALGQKSLAKVESVRQAWKRASKTSFRLLAVMFGVLSYSHSIARIARLPGASRYYRFCRFVAERAREAQENPQLWEEGIAILPDTIIEEAESWLCEVIANAPAPVLQPPPRPTHVLCTDASSERWAALWINLLEGSWEVISGTFPEGLRSKFSTVTEPFAIRAAMNIIDPSAAQHTIILTDHLGLLGGIKKGFSPSNFYNATIFAARSDPRWNRAQWAHIPGVINPANEPSRNMAVDPSTVRNVMRAFDSICGTGTGPTFELTFSPVGSTT